ncbi:MAG: hypothetical protein ACRD0O_02975 [Acidimicrobiia bacterium]
MDRNEEITLSEPTVYGWLETMYGIRPQAPSAPVRPAAVRPAAVETRYEGPAGEWLYRMYGIGDGPDAAVARARWLFCLFGVTEDGRPRVYPRLQLAPAFFNNGIAGWLWNLYGIAYPAAAPAERAA